MRSTSNWRGRRIVGDTVELGFPAVDPADGTFVWDHPLIGADWMDADGDAWYRVVKGDGRPNRTGKDALKANPRNLPVGGSGFQWKSAGSLE